MSRRRPKPKPKPAGRKADHALYLYCIGEGDALRPLLHSATPPAIEHDAHLELIESDMLAAVVSAVALSDYNEEVLGERISDPAWTALRAMRHQKLVEYFASRASIIPLRFGTIYLDRDRIRQVLSEGSISFGSIIERLRGREEWSLNIYCDRARLREAIVSASPKLRELARRAAAASPGQAFLLRKKMEAARAEEMRAEIIRIVETTEADLASLSCGSARLRILKNEGGQEGDTVSRQTFLVERARFDDFRAAAERLAGIHAALGIKFELTGPWPAYNFVGQQ